MRSAVRVLAELIAEHEAEWETFEPNRPGRCYYVAQKLIADGYENELSALILKPGETLIVRAPASCTEEQAGTIRDQFYANGVKALVMLGLKVEAVQTDGTSREVRPSLAETVYADAVREYGTPEQKAEHERTERAK